MLSTQIQGERTPGNVNLVSPGPYLLSLFPFAVCNLHPFIVINCNLSITAFLSSVSPSSESLASLLSEGGLFI